MPRTKSYLTPAEYAVLGLLRQSPAYGYELQRQLSGGQGLARVCPVEPAMVYAILKSLSGLELIDGEWDNSSYPPRAVYAATTEGDATFQRWLRQPECERCGWTSWSSSTSSWKRRWTTSASRRAT
jgi:DNA-binding PadR family transcriptional regulator